MFLLFSTGGITDLHQANTCSAAASDYTLYMMNHVMTSVCCLCLVFIYDGPMYDGPMYVV